MSDPSTAAAKRALRSEVLARLRALPATVRVGRSAQLREHVMAAVTIAPGTTVALFAALPSEPDLAPLVTDPRNAGAIFVFPRGGPDFSLSWHPIDDPKALGAAANTLREPDPKRFPAVGFPPAGSALVLVPGLAFDPSTGVRLGRGGGYYDRFLAALPPAVRKIGACFSEQLVEGLPADTHDVAVDLVITDRGAITPTGAPSSRTPGSL